MVREPGDPGARLGRDDPRPTDGCGLCDSSEFEPRDRSRSPRVRDRGIHGGHIDCPQDSHCPTCTTAGDCPLLKDQEVEVGCCGEDQCCTTADEWSTTVLARPDGAGAAAWRFAAYKAAFRSIHGIGESGVRVPHKSCVVYSIRHHVDMVIKQEEEAQPAGGG